VEGAGTLLVTPTRKRPEHRRYTSVFGDGFIQGFGPPSSRLLATPSTVGSLAWELSGTITSSDPCQVPELGEYNEESYEVDTIHCRVVCVGLCPVTLCLFFTFPRPTGDRSLTPAVVHHERGYGNIGAFAGTIGGGT